MAANRSYYVFTKIKRLGEFGADFSLQHIDLGNQFSKAIGGGEGRVSCHHINKIDRLPFRSIQAVSLGALEKLPQTRYKLRPCCHD